VEVEVLFHTTKLPRGLAARAAGRPGVGWQPLCNAGLIGEWGNGELRAGGRWRFRWRAAGLSGCYALVCLVGVAGQAAYGRSPAGRRAWRGCLAHGSPVGPTARLTGRPACCGLGRAVALAAAQLGEDGGEVGESDGEHDDHGEAVVWSPPGPPGAPVRGRRVSRPGSALVGAGDGGMVSRRGGGVKVAGRSGLVRLIVFTGRLARARAHVRSLTREVRARA